MKKSSSTNANRRRSGVTLMECIFAIGVILTGLVGLAALIPLAANNARATLELDRSISESTSSAAKGIAQSFNDLDALVIFDKPTVGSTGVAGAYGYAPSRNLRTIDWKLNGQQNVDPPIGATMPPVFSYPGKLESPGYGHMALGSGLHSGICIDPLGMPDPGLAPPNRTPTTADSAFDHSRFPYYGERYNVLAAPNEAIGNPGAPPNWPMSPRMWRATLRSPLYDAPTVVLGSPTLPLTRPYIVSALAARKMFLGSGGVSQMLADEKTDPRAIQMSQALVGNAFVDTARDVSSDYSWFVTLAPPFLGGDTFRQSVVVVRKRQPPVPLRVNDPLALNPNSYAIDGPDDNPAAERVTWVGNALGFSTGSGGEVQLYGSQSVSDSVVTGQWVMLSRQPHTGAPLVPTGPAVHRWYRVLRVGESEQVSGYAWPGGTHDVWRRWISLVGSDWVFQDEATNTTPIDDTFCTIVTGAVSVVESEVVIQ
ncbi:MAG: hypothetical protein AB8B91_11230 [Rubripirellula sp.]